jgi:hypothetical protein
VVQVAPQGGLTDVYGLCQVRQGHEALPANEVEHMLTAFFHQHGSFLKEIERNMSSSVVLLRYFDRI